MIVTSQYKGNDASSKFCETKLKKSSFSLFFSFMCSDYDSYKKLSGSQLSIMSRSSISEKVEKTKKKLRRALSLDKLSSSNKDSYSLEKPKVRYLQQWLLEALFNIRAILITKIAT